MYLLKYLTTNQKNHLEIGGCDTIELAKQYGTPAYIMDEDRIRQNMRAYKNAIDKYYDGHGMVLYASKALSAMYLYKITAEEGLGADVVSGGELYTALQAGFNPKNLYFHGNNKTYDEIEFAIQSKVGTFVVDSIEELKTIDEISKSKDCITEVMFRIKPGVEAHTHEFISTGQIDSKFGFAIENGEALDIIKQAKNMEHIKITGIHCHIGSQIFELEPFELAAIVMIDFFKEVKDKLGIEMSKLDLGGGFGIRYTADDKPIEYEKFIESVSKKIKLLCKKYDLKLPYILMEPGRSIVGDAGITIYTVGNIKHIPNVRKYLSIDGGMGDNPRYILYEAPYDGVLANKVNDPADETYTVCGKCCESGDIIMESANLPKAEPGDILAVMSTGAYNYSMASNYNRIPRPPVVMVKDGRSKLAVKRETYEDLIKNDIL